MEVIMEKLFKLVSKYKPSGDQPKAIDNLVKGINEGKKEQVLLGATGTGKTFTIANVIAETNKPTLVLAHNKTLAGQLYAELKEFFKQKRKNQTVIDFEKYKLLDEDSEILSLYNELAIRSKQSILYSMKDLDANNDYFKYYNSRYMEIRRYHQLVDTINFLNDNKIFGYETLEEQIEKLKQDIISKETEYQELAYENETLQLRVPLCNLYLEYLDIYESYKEQQELSSSRIASAIATAIPSSPPKVVPLA